MTGLLIVANSGRMLAQSAKQAGYDPVVIDLYADKDTRQYSLACYKVKTLANTDLEPAVETVISTHDIRHVVYGSGLEQYPESLVYLASHLLVLGNSAEAFVKIQDKLHFFAACTSLGINYPEVNFTKPETTKDWLVKPMQGQGGIGICRYESNPAPDNPVYWQKYQTGYHYSALFLADGLAAQLIGFNAQWTVSQHDDMEFVFEGIINHCPLEDTYKLQLAKKIQQLVLRFGLKGLNTLDFIHENGNSYILEINPRPSASMQLYDADLFKKHISACQGILSDQLPDLNHYTGWQIVYAPTNISIPLAFKWPEWCADLPESATLIHTGQPICSIIAHEIEPEQVLAQLMLQQQQLIKQLTRC